MASSIEIADRFECKNQKLMKFAMKLFVQEFGEDCPKSVKES